MGRRNKSKAKGKEEMRHKKKEELRPSGSDENGISDSDKYDEIIVQLPSLLVEDATISIKKTGSYWEEKLSILRENLKLEKSENCKILRSMACPFSGLEGIEWKIQAPIHLERDIKIPSKYIPYSIVSFCRENICKKNVIYGSDGKCIVQVDFEDHGSGGPHFHVLIPGVLDHTAGKEKDHAFNWTVCPWLWLAIPHGYNVNTNDGSFNLEEVTLSTRSFSTNRIEQLVYSFNEWCIQKIKQLPNTKEQKELLVGLFLFAFMGFAIYGSDIGKAILSALENIENSGFESEEEEMVAVKKIRRELEEIEKNPQNSRAATFSEIIKPLISNSYPIPNDTLPSKKTVGKFFGDLIEQDGNIVAIDKSMSQAAMVAVKSRDRTIQQSLTSSWPPLVFPASSSSSSISEQKLSGEQTDSSLRMKSRKKIRPPCTYASSFFHVPSSHNSKFEKKEESSEEEIKEISEDEVKDIIATLRKKKEHNSSSSTSGQPTASKGH